MPRPRFPRLGWLLLAALALAFGSVIWLVVGRGHHEASTSIAAPVQPASSAREPTLSIVSAQPIATPTSVERAEVAHGPSTVGCTLTVLDAAGAPIAGAEAWESEHVLPRVSDKAGRLRFDDEVSEVIVVAEGFLPAEVQVSEPVQELRLRRDSGLALTLRWDDGAPVVGARVEAAFASVEIDAERLARLALPAEPTDAEGRTVVRPYRIGLHTAHLRIEASDAQRIVLPLPKDLDLDGPAAFEAQLDKHAAAHRIRVRDAQGNPLADREIKLHSVLDEVARTDADGYASFDHQETDPQRELPEGTRYSFSVAIEIDPDRAWWYETRRRPPKEERIWHLRVEHRRVFGRVESPSPGAYVVATAAGKRSQEIGSGRIHRGNVHPDDLDELTWQKVAEDGSFEIVDGWQGPESVVILRHRDHFQELWVEPVPESGGPILLRAPDVCRVSVVSGTPLRAPIHLMLSSFELTQTADESDDIQAGVVISRTGSFSLSSILNVPIARVPAQIELPRARYSVAVSAGEDLQELGELDASGPVAEVEIPAIVHVKGRIVGSRRGPLDGVRVSLGSVALRSSVDATTNRDGWFEAQVLGSGEIRVAPRFDDFVHLGPLRGRGLEPALDARNPVAEYVIPEAVLHVVERPPSPLLGFKELWLDAMDGEERVRSKELEIGSDGHAQVYVAPGTYRIRRRFDAWTVQEATVTIESDGEQQVVLDSSRMAVIRVSVTVGDPPHRTLRFRARDERGSVVAFDAARRLRGEAHEFTEIVDPGTYALEIQSRHIDASSDDPPVDVWRGDYDARPGAQFPLRIHLR